MIVVPAVLTNNVTELNQLLRQVELTKKFERVQIDFIDGSFANNFTIKPMEVDLVAFHPLKFDAHLMVTEENVLIWEKIAWKMGFDQVIVQMESVSTPEDYTGLSLDIHSPLEALVPHLRRLTAINLMSVEPGFGGQEFHPEVLEKIKRLKELREEKKYQYKICVDGGIEQEHMNILEEAGADEVAVGAARVLSW